MRLLLDTCVLYPSVMRATLLEVAAEGLFVPFWSERILEEWRRATAKLGPAGQMQAEAEITLLRARWPGAIVAPSTGLEARLWLPDENDIHVLASAIQCSADAIVTVNARDFPRGILAEEGLLRFDPDALLTRLDSEAPDKVEAAAKRVLAQANAEDGRPWDMRPLMKKARLPRLGKALSQTISPR